MTQPSSPGARAQLVRGEVRHRRLRPALHQFALPTFYLLLPMRSLRQQAEPALRRNRFAWLSFHDRDHGQGGEDALAWIDGLLEEAGVRAEGEIWLQTYPRMLGYVFKPVSFWYCHGADGRLAAIVAEVNNTFGERHCYLLQGPDLAWGRELQASKVFHVSPFCQVEGQYRFRFMRTDDRIVSRVDLDDAQGALLQTSLSGHLELLSAASLRRALWRWPWQSLAVTLRIHMHALRLWLKGVPFFSKPAAPAEFVSRGSA